MTADRLPQFVIAGAPKAGTTALHAALATHPDLYSRPSRSRSTTSPVVGHPPAASTGAPETRTARASGCGAATTTSGCSPTRRRRRCGGGTPFYLYDRSAQERLVADVPGIKVIAVVRDPVDRAWSNWVHLRADGLEPEADFLQAVRLEERRIADGWAPFWHYRGLGRYGEQVHHLLELLPRPQVLVLRYRALVDHPGRRWTASAPSSACRPASPIPSTRRT